MANLKAIRKRIGSVKSTQKITRAMKMVAAARLVRAQTAITELRPYAIKTYEVLSSVALRSGEEDQHPLLAQREERRVLLVVLTSDRGLAGAFNASVCKAAHAKWKELEAKGVEVSFAVIGRKGRDYFRRRDAVIRHELTGVFENLDADKAGEVGRLLVREYVSGSERETERGRFDFDPDVNLEDASVLPKNMASERETAQRFVDASGFEGAEPQLDAVYLVYNEFKSAITQQVTIEPLLPIAPAEVGADEAAVDFIYEPSKRALLDRLLPMYVEIEIFRALLESVASEHGARMTAMDAATKNAADMIDRLTLVYNRARQAAITTELMEIIGGAEALKG